MVSGYIAICINFQVQFFVVFVHSAQAFIFDCGYPKLVAGLLLLHSLIFIVLFSDFYRTAYRRGKSFREVQREMRYRGYICYFR